jgi:hypothetical protein
MRDLVMLDWMTPERPWTVFCHTVESEHGSLEGYLGRKVTDAMDEFAEADGYERVEDLVDRLVQAAGRTPGEVPKEKNPASSDLSQLPTTRVTVRVDRDVKERFKAAAEESAYDSYGVALGRALQLYCEGGRAARLEGKLDRVVDDAESLLAELDSSADDDTLGKVDRNVIQICNRLTEEFTDAELNSEIHDVAGNGPRVSDPTLEKYRDLVTERLGVERHPSAETVWVPSHKASQYAPDGLPDVCRRPVQNLDREQRTRRLRLALGCRAARQGNGYARTDSTEIGIDVFDDNLTKATVLSIMNEAALEDGYELDKSTTPTTLTVDLVDGITDGYLAEDIVDYKESPASGLLSGSSETTVDDWSAKTSPPTASAVDENLDRLTSATDGGGPPRKDGDHDE